MSLLQEYLGSVGEAVFPVGNIPVPDLESELRQKILNRVMMIDKNCPSPCSIVEQLSSIGSIATDYTAPLDSPEDSDEPLDEVLCHAF